MNRVQTHNEQIGHVVSCGTGRTFEFVPALEHLGPNFETKHIERESSNYAYQLKYVHKVTKLIQSCQERDSGPVYLILLDFSLASFLLCFRYFATAVLVIIRIRFDYFKQLASQLHALRLKRILTAFVQLPMMLAADQLIGISFFQIRRLPSPQKKVCYVPVIRHVSDDVDNVFPRDDRNKVIRFITVSNFEHWPKTRGTLEMINHFNEAAKGINCTLDVYGRGRYARKIADAAEDSPWVKYCGYTNNIEHVYRQADAFLYGSYLESFGASLLEARLHGLPCAILDYPSLREQVQDPRQIIPSGDRGRKKLEAFIAFAISDEARQLAKEDKQTAGRYLRWYLGEFVK